MSNYNLVLGKGVSVNGATASDVLRELADFIEDGGFELLSVNITYNLDDGDYTAFGLYE